jgi:hypothetical protein
MAQIEISPCRDPEFIQASQRDPYAHDLLSKFATKESIDRDFSY